MKNKYHTLLTLHIMLSLCQNGVLPNTKFQVGSYQNTDKKLVTKLKILTDFAKITSVWRKWR